jgi:shikimate dehydrogenase
VIHAAALRTRELQGEYLLYPIQPIPEGVRALKALLDDLRMGKIDGFNVTIPHKESIQPLLDRQTPVAEAIGAVNTILRDGDELIGDNTDMEGFLRDLDATLSPRFDGALILGAGGAARAVAHGLCKREWKVWVASRRLDQATELAVSVGGNWDQSNSPIPLEVGEIETILSEITLIVNATPLGMAPNLDVSPWPWDLPFPEDASIYDLVSVPQETALAFELWTGREAPRAVMRSAALAAVA